MQTCRLYEMWQGRRNQPGSKTNWTDSSNAAWPDLTSNELRCVLAVRAKKRKRKRKRVCACVRAQIDLPVIESRMFYDQQHGIAHTRHCMCPSLRLLDPTASGPPTHAGFRWPLCSPTTTKRVARGDQRDVYRGSFGTPFDSRCKQPFPTGCGPHALARAKASARGPTDQTLEVFSRFRREHTGRQSARTTTRLPLRRVAKSTAFGPTWRRLLGA